MDAISSISQIPVGFEWQLWHGRLQSSCQGAHQPTALWHFHSPWQTPVCWRWMWTELDVEKSGHIWFLSNLSLRKVPSVRPPESTLHTRVISVSWIKHFHFIRQQVWKDGVLLKALNVVGTAEKCDYTKQCKQKKKRERHTGKMEVKCKRQFKMTNIKIMTYLCVSCHLWNPMLLIQAEAYWTENSGLLYEFPLLWKEVKSNLLVFQISYMIKVMQMMS